MKCTSEKQADKATKELIRDNGEGIILRKPGSFYEHSRSSNLLKLKVLLFFLSFIFFKYFIVYRVMLLGDERRHGSPRARS